MPYKRRERKRWRGQIKWQGKLYRADFETRREAAEWEVVKRKEQEAEIPPTPIALDLVSFFNDYLEHAEMRFVKRTFKEKKALCHRFLEMFGNMPAEDVTAEMVHRYLKVQAEKRSANSSNRDRKNFLAMWNWGRDILNFESNPATRIKPLPHERGPQYTPPTEDVLRILAVATREERVFLNCYLQTAARRGEVFRWTWNEDINFDRREVRLGTRKTRDGSMSYEWLPMNEELYQELWWWWKNRPIKDTPYVFVSTSKKPGRHYGQPYRERRWFMESLCKRAGVKAFGFHALRRYCASLLADTHKISAKTIQRVLRHKNVTTTERYIKNINRDLGTIMELLGKKGSPEGLPKHSNEVGNEG
jgi:integrase